MNMSRYLEQKLLDHVFRNTPYTQPTTVYCGIVSNVSSDANMEAGTLTDEITEYTGNRPEVTFSTTEVFDGYTRVKNTADVEFHNVPAVTLKYAIITDSPTKGEGNILYWNPLRDSELEPITKTANAGDTFRIKEDELICEMN